jgi:hypothetical protein
MLASSCMIVFVFYHIRMDIALTTQPHRPSQGADHGLPFTPSAVAMVEWQNRNPTAVVGEEGLDSFPELTGDLEEAATDYSRDLEDTETEMPSAVSDSHSDLDEQDTHQVILHVPTNEF